MENLSEKPKDNLKKAEELIEVGNYRDAKKYLKGVMDSTTANEELKKKAKEKNENLKVDKNFYWVLLGSFAFVALIFVYFWLKNK